VSTIRRPDLAAVPPTRRPDPPNLRDQAAQQRDVVATRRDREADIADLRALELDGTDAAADGRTPQDQQLVARGLDARRRAARDRERSKTDRRLAGADRESGESDREVSRAWGHLAALVDCSEDAIVAKSLDGEIESWNRAAEELFGFTAAEMVGRPHATLVPADGQDEHAGMLAQIRRGERVEPKETVRLTKDGRRLDVALRVSLVYDSTGELVGASSISRDITDRVRIERALRAAEHRFHTVFDRAPIGICLVSLEAGDAARLVQVNPAIAELLGRGFDQLVGAPLACVTHADDQAEIHAKLGELTASGRDHVEFETRLVHGDGHVVWVLISGALLSDGAEEPALAITHVIDISDRKRAEHQLQHLADHDALTGLFNRRRFTEELTRALRLTKRHGDAGAVLFLDLDGFKFVNDTLGHAAGDELIARVAGLLGGAVRETDTLARIGGDEFAILLTRCDRAAALGVGEKLLTLLRNDGLADRHDRRPHVSSSVGIALFSGDDVIGPDELVVHADIAMYDAKNAGKDRCAIYDAERRPVRRGRRRERR
jgi:diguanylate cyclase (GGDEF)-like protein/PAS domain S-box-containing protein